MSMHKLAKKLLATTCDSKQLTFTIDDSVGAAGKLAGSSSSPRGGKNPCSHERAMIKAWAWSAVKEDDREGGEPTS
eukprot:1157484-Pelagomonas_calceolata.AAC.3